MINVTEQELWDDYTHYHSRTGYYKQKRAKNPYVRPMKATPERLKLMGEMKEWCEVRNIPVRQWLFSLFATRRWLYAPKLEKGHLCSVNHVKKFKTFKNYDLYTQRVMEQAANKPKSILDFDPNRDMSHTAEEAKRAYVQSGRTDTCMDQMTTETFGYHPKSKICLGCVQKKECSDKLQASVKFDIIALRRGHITAEQAYRTALVQGRGYGS